MPDRARPDDDPLRLVLPRDTIALPDFDPSDAIDFWDLTNRQDWHVCELQQQGTASRACTAGRYSNQEDSVHAFDLMCADRYANDGRRRSARSRNRAAAATPEPRAGRTSRSPTRRRTATSSAARTTARGEGRAARVAGEEHRR